jgi:hypothetical protein
VLLDIEKRWVLRWLQARHSSSLDLRRRVLRFPLNLGAFIRHAPKHTLTCRVHDFLQISSLLREAAGQVPGGNLARLTDGVTEALSHFIQAELNFRKAERYEALRALPERAARSGSRGEREQTLGLRALASGRRIFPQAREDVGRLGIDPRRAAEVLPEVTDDIRVYLADSELKTKDIKRIDEVLTEITQIVQSGGLQGLVAHMERSAEEMEQLRRSPNRGNVDNFPLWKLGGIIVLLGVAIIGVIHCGIFGCSISTRNTYLAALIITALVQIRSAALRSTQNSLPSGSANVTQPEPSARMWSATSLAPSAVSRSPLHPWFRGRAPHPGAAGSSPSCSPMYAGNSAGSVTVEFGG